MPLCRCSWLYHCTNCLAQCRAASRSANPLVGNSGRYLAVRNSASANALSSLTRGREWDGAMPSQCSMASTVVPFRVAPLSPCSTGRADMACTPSAKAVRLAKCAACSALSGVVHLEADDLAAVEIQDQVQVEPAALHLRRQEGHVPAPDLPWSGGH